MVWSFFYFNPKIKTTIREKIDEPFMLESLNNYFSVPRNSKLRLLSFFNNVLIEKLPSMLFP